MKRYHSFMKASAVIVALALLLTVCGNVFAVSTTQTSPAFNLSSGEQVLSTVHYQDTQSDVDASFDIVTSLNWFQTATISATYDDNLVRQGRALDPVIDYNRAGSGFIVVQWTLTNMHVAWGGIDPPDMPDMTFAASGIAELPADGSTNTYHLESGQIDVVHLYAMATPYVKMNLAADVTINSQGIATLRQVTFGGNPDGTADLLLGDMPVTDGLFVPCEVGVDDELIYTLGDLSTTQGVTVVSMVELDVGMCFVVDDANFATPSFNVGTDYKDINLTAPGFSLSFGAVKANNIPPVASPGGPYTGEEGTPVVFDGSASRSVCGKLPILRWDFSDGGVAYGPTPQHTFQGPGVYSGLLTATDLTGLSATATFSVEIANLDPVANAGPNMSTKWGIPIVLNGSGLNPGTEQQPYLAYRWNFGDGTPSASGGASVSHVYGTPGTYTAALTVTDPMGASDSDSALVVVYKRDTLLGYTGLLTSKSSQTIPLKAVLTDEFGNPLAGRYIVFQLGAQGPFTVMTDSNGVAAYNLKLKQKPGTYALTVNYPLTAADAVLYTSASVNTSFVITK